MARLMFALVATVAAASGVLGSKLDSTPEPTSTTTDTPSGEGRTVPYKVRVKNLTYKQPFSPIVITAHTTDKEVFHEGEVARPELKILAETGDYGPGVITANSPEFRPFVCGSVFAEAPLFPGETFYGTMDVFIEKCNPNEIVWSMVSMMLSTNDGFVGVDSEKLVTKGASKTFAVAFDAGTEVNNELCTHVPGPACPDGSGNMEEEPAEGFVHVHRGIHDVGDIDASVYDWRNPVAEVVIWAP